MKKEDEKQQQTSQSNNKSQYAFCYTLGHVHILINQQVDVEILTTSTTYKIPHAPKWYVGTTSLRGDILPVVNMHFLLGLKPSSTTAKPTKQTLLRLKHPDFPALVIVIDGLPYQTDISHLLTQTTPNTNLYPPWVESSTNDNNTLYLFANYALLLTALQNDNQQQLIMPPQAITQENT